MKTLSRILVVALVLAGAPLVALLDPLAGGVVTVAVCALAASVVAGVISPMTLIFGALAALSHTLIWSEAPVLAGASTFVCLYAGRAVRARGGKSSLAIQLALAGLTAAIATQVVLLHLYAGWQLQLVAVVVGALLVSAPLLIAVDDHLTAELRAMALRSSGVLRWRLERAVTLRRKISSQTGTMASGDADKVERAFMSLVRLAKARQAASSDSVEVLDDSIADHLTALERGLAAIDRRTALRTGMETGRAEEMQREAEQIEAEAQALIEVTGSPVAVDETR
jgi:hypothetical protein